MNSNMRCGTTWLLCACLVLSLGPSRVAAQRRAIVVSAEQPNVWTLEQAHYLLAQMHRRNLDLKATGLGELNPNEINGLSFDVLRTLLEVGVAFNGADRFNNNLLKRDKSFDAERAIRLQNRRDQLADQSIVLTRGLARLERERALSKSQEERDVLSAQITELTTVRDGNDKSVERLDNDLKTATGPSGELKPTEAEASFDENKLPKTIFDDAFKETTKKLINDFNQAPKLNASLRLDNFLQMQYEIIAKQLTLLRDEVGPGERIIFLEMPQTVNAAHDKANKKWAQSWWQVAGYTTPVCQVSAREQNIKRMEIGTTDSKCKRSQTDPKSKASQTDEPLTTRNVVEDATNAVNAKSSGRVNYYHLSTDTGNSALEDRSVRAVELIPRQSSLNVNDLKLRARSGVLTAVAKTLFGFGARLNFQRQRESFSQFVQQELYASGFGKGSREFGWTFTPMPGTDRLLSGTRTTYAVMVVPIEAEALVLKSVGCYFPRSEYQPINFNSTMDKRWTDPDKQSRNCGEQRAFVVPIPGGGNMDNDDFWVDGLEYVPAEKNDPVTLLIYGRNFPAQIGMMVDGVPLPQSIGVAQPLIRDDSTAFAKAHVELKDARLNGRFERIDANQIVAVLERPNGKEGIQPVITLTAPGKAKIINTMKLYINRLAEVRLGDNKVDLMFGKKPPGKKKFRIDEVEIFRSRTSGNLTALINGAGFASGQSAFINGIPVGTVMESPTLLRAEFPVPADETIRVKVIAPNVDPAKTETIESDPVSNPARLRISDVEVIAYDAATESDPDAVLVVKITGTGFTDALKSSMGEIAIKSVTEAILTVTNPKAAATVVLEDENTGQKVKTVITRRTGGRKE